MTSTVDPGPVRARAGRAWPAVAGLLLLATLAPEPAHAQTGICGRTKVVRDALVALIPGVSHCANVTADHLAAITGELALNGVHGEDPRVTALAARDFDGLTSLEELSLGTNALTTLPGGVFDDLTALRDLSIEQNRLTELPDEVFDNLTSLTSLDLRDNRVLTELPDEVFDNLTALRTLRLRGNGMTELVDGMFDNLTTLTWLQLAVNELTELPDGMFDNLTALRDLDLSNNELTELPDEVFDNLTALSDLDLSNNELTELPDDVFDNLTALTLLGLAINPGAPFAPTADALPDDGKVPVAGGTVTLDGSGSGGAWGTNVTHSWALTNPPSGVTVTFDDSTSATPMVTIPALTTGTELTFTLTVTGRGTTDRYSNGGAPGTDTATVTVSPAGTLLLALDAIAGDNTVNIAEKAAGFSIGGATGTESGVSVTVTVGTTELTATSAAGGAWSVAVPAGASYITGTNVAVTVSASKTGYTPPGDVTRALAVDLAAPSAAYTAPSSLQVGVAVGALTPSTTDTDIASYGATGLPPGLGIDTGTGVIGGTPDTADANTADATVTVTDTAGNTDTVDITFPAVSKGDQTLTGFAYSPATVTYGDTAPAVTAPSGVQTTLSYSATPSDVCTVDASTGALTLVGLGECAVTATAASSDDYNQGTATYTVTVTAAGTLDLTLDTIAGDNTVNIAEKAAGFSIGGATGTESGVSVTVTVGTTELTATSAAGGAWSVAVPAGASYITGTNVAVTVSASKTGYTPPGDVTRALAVDLAAPSATYTAPSSLQVGVAVGALTPSTTDTDIASYGATGLPPGLGIDTGTGVIGGTPDTADANTADATVTVTDTAGNTDTVDITFPAVSKGDQTLTGFAYSPATVTYGDTAPAVTAPSGVQTTLSYSAAPSDVCTVEASTGALTLVGVGECVITATAAGAADYNEATAAFTVTVQAAGALALTLDAIAGDDTVNIAEKAAGFAISGDTGSEGGVSVTVTVGSTPLTATSDSGGAWSVAVPANAAYLTGTSVTVTVSASKTGYTAPSDVTRALAVDLAAPSATYAAPPSLQVGVAVGALTPSTTDTDIASYGATGLPPGLGIDTGTGVIGGTPDTADANTADATVTVTDTAGNTATVDIAFPAVAKGDQTLTGFAYSPASVTYGDTAPAVTAPSGVQTTLSYSAAPSDVCTVDASTGALTLVGVGECNITATAAGAADYNEATAAFTVTVQAAGALALTLDAIAGDDTVNIAEKAAGFAISGDTGSEGGVSVTVTVGSTPLTATSATAGAWSVDVPPGASYITGTSVAVTVSASKTGYTAPSDVTRTLAVDLAAPSATYTAPSSLQVGVAVVAMTPSTTDTDIASYGATGLPSGLGIDTGTGVISGTPDTADANTADATVTVTDTAGNTATVSITFPAVAKGDQTLTGFAYSPATVTYGDTAPAVTAPSGVQTTLSYSAAPSDVCTVEASTGALTLVGVGECNITATAAGAADYNEATAAFTVTVQAAGALALTLDTIAGDDTVNIAEKAAGFAISGATGSQGGVSVTVTVGTTELTATSAAAGAWSVDVPANAAYLTGTSVAVTVSASKTGYTSPSDVTRALAVDLAAPSATYTAPSSLQVGVAVGALTPSTTDTDIASYGAAGLPSGLDIDSTTGAISGTPDTADANTADATVTVRDTAGNTDTVSITFPVVAKGDQTLTGFAYSPTTVTYGDTAPAVTAPGGVQTTLSYSAAPATVCTVNASTGALTPVGVGDCNITATAAPSDDYNQGTATYTVTVAAAGTLALTLDAIAGDNTVNIAEKAAGFAISGATGSQGGVSVTVTVGATELTATSAAAGAWSVDVPANAAYLTGSSVTVTVSASKTGYTAPSDVTRALAVDLTAPSATYTAPSSLQVGVAVGALTPSTTDTDIASYGAPGLPPGLGIDSTTGAISGTPDTADANTADATVTVTDTAGNTDTVDITFPAVAKGDQTLTGFAYSPATVTFGDTAPAVTAPGGVQTTLSYSAAPSDVCTVEASTGALTLVGLGECNITATAAPSDDYNQGTATYTVTVTAAGTLDLTLDTIAGDDTVNIAEKAAGFAISGATGSQGGVSVTVTVGATELTATSASAGAWSVEVPANAAYLTGSSVTVTVSASKTGYTAPSDVTRALAVDLVAPSATYTAPSSLQVGVAVGALTPSTTDTDIASYGAPGLPPGLGIDSTTGAISGTPDTADANTADATVTVTDTAGNTDTVDITFPAVSKGDQTLTGFAYSPATVTFGDTAPAVTAPGGVQTTLSYSATPSDVCTVEASTGALTLVGVGECNITATAAPSDDYNQGTATYTVTVAAAGTLALTLDAIAGDNTVNIAEKAAGFAISGATGSQGGVSVTVTVGGTELTATSASAGAWSVEVPANAAYLTGTSVAVTVSASKTGYTAPSDVTRALAVDLAAPSATYTAPSSLQVGVAIGAMTPSTTDTDIASYGATGLPAGLGIDSTTGAISGTPDTADANTADATVTVRDTAGNTDTVSITFPVVAKGDQTLTGFAYSPTTVTYGDTAPAVTAPGGVQTTLSYSAAPATVCTVNASTGALTPVGVGDCNITATAAPSDDYNQGTATYTVTVAAAGTLALTLDAIAGDNTVNIAEKAAGFAISGATGSQGGVSVTVTVGTTELTATSAAAGAWSVAVPANAAYLTGTSVTVTVSASKTGYTAPSDVTRALAVDLTAPSATYTAPSSLQVGVAIGALTPSTTDTDIASYGAPGLPPGLGIDSTTGAISGTPDTADANTADATVTVTDTAGNTDTVDITFPAVAKGDQTLTGFAYSPASVTFGGAAPAVTAPGGVQTTLSYSAAPATVCTVEASTGALTLVGVGNCVITATAAGAANYNEATAAFTVTVAAAGTLALTLDAIAGDNTVNIAEKAAGFTISGDTGSEGGVSVTVTVGTTELTATSAAGAWSVAVPANAAYLTGTSVTVTVSASKTGYTAPSDVTRALAVDLAAPSATYTAPSSLQVGVAIGTMTPSTTDTDIASYGATGLPPGLGIDSTTGAISGTPDTADSNTADATVTVTDTAGNTDTVDITFPAVARGDQTLTGFAYSSATVTFGGAAAAVTAPGGVQTTLSYSATPSNVCTVDASTGALTLVGVGECNITVTAAPSDDYNQGTATYTVTVAAAGTLVLNLDTIAGDDTVNIAEKAAGFAISGDTGSEGGVSVTVTVGATELTATSASAGAWSVAVPPGASYLTGTSVAVTVSASKTGYTSPSEVTRALAVDLAAPSATYTAPSSLQVGVAIGALTPSTTDTDIASYGATGLPPGLGIDTGTGVIGGTPDTADANTADATVTVTDTAGNTDTVDITFPAVAKGDQTLTGFAYSPASVTFGGAAPAVTAPGGVQTTLSYSAAPATVCTVEASTGALTLVGVGNCVITATAAGAANYNEATAAFTVTVAAAGTLALTLDAIAGDDTVNIAEKAAGFAISGDTGSEGGVSVTVTVGSTPLTATSDSGGAWSVDVPANAAYLTGTSVAVTVSASKTGYTSPSDVTRALAVDLAAPSATYTAPSSLQVGVAVGALTPSTTDTDIASYGATGLPPGLGIDTGTGVIGGTPDTADANTADATVTVTDTAGNTDTVDITFPAVAKGDQTLTGFAYSPASVTFGGAAPAVTAPGGVQTTLSYSAAPATVCTVEASTGALTLVGVGECNITATAASSDDYNQGTATYTVTVAAAGTLALTLDAIAGDNTVNIAEKAAGFTISGDTGSEGGVSVTVTVGTTELTATSAAGAWSVAVPANAAYLTGTSVTVTVSASKTGYTAPSDVTRALAVDLAAPSATYTAPSSLQVGVAIGTMTPSTTDTDIASYGATGLPPGLGIDSTTGAISGTPDTADANTADATVTVRDTAGNTATVSITFPAVALTDNDVPQGTVSFDKQSFTVTEGATRQVLMQVDLSGPLDREVTIPLTTTHGSGVEANDYVLAAIGAEDYYAGNDTWTSLDRNLVFAPAETGKIVRVTAVDDSIEEDDEVLEFGFGTLPEGISPGPIVVATVTIIDNDGDAEPAPGVTLHLSDADGEVAEDAGAVTVTATVSPASASAFTVTVTATPVAPATDADFTLSTNRVLRFAANATASTGTVTIAPVDDGDAEPTQVVTVSGSASVAGVTGPDDMTLTILDDDVLRIRGICDRTPRVRDRILVRLKYQHGFKDTCAEVTEAHLAKLTLLDLRRNPSKESAFTLSLQQHDFEGLSNLVELDLADNGLASLPAGVFNGLTNLETLNLNENRLGSLPPGVFAGLRSLETLRLQKNPSLESLPYDELEELPALTLLRVDREGRRKLQVAGGEGDAALEVAAGGSATYRVRLMAAPDFRITAANPVRIGVNSDTAGVTASPETLPFTREDWFRRQTVTVRAEASASGATATLAHEPSGTTTDSQGQAQSNYDFEQYPLPKLTVTVTVPGGEAGRSADPLSADVEGLPSSHDGETAFSFRIAFSEDVATSADDMRDHALTVTGGTVTDAARVDGRADLWSITVTPSGTGEITILLPPGRDCSEEGAVCTADGRQLPTGLARIVAGPVNATATVPRITAVQVTSVPELERDTYGRGETIRFTVSFSEAVEVTGSPHFTFSLGNRGVARKVDAAYESGSGTAALVFGYMVQEGDEDNNGIFLVDGAALGRAGPVALDAGEAITAPGGGVDADLSSSARGIERDHKVDGSRAPEGPGRSGTNTAAAGAPTISGTPQVGEELTASTSGISDADGLENASFAYQWIRGDRDIGGATRSRYTAVDADEGERLKVRVRFTDDAGHAESLTSAATQAVAARPEPLTAEFVDMPAEHRGEGGFHFRVAFSEDIGISFAALREDAFRVTGGRVTGGKRVDGRRDLFRMTVRPDSDGEVTITLPAGRACGVSGAICTKSEPRRQLTNSPSATVRGPVGISVADARVDEGEGAVLRFAVTLSRAASGTLTVDYATSDGSAHAGDDYRTASGTLSFGAGETSQRIEVAVLDDDHDEGEETLTLTLSNPSSGRLTDGEATGTIKNRDPMPRALLARFGRTAAVHVVEQVEERLEARREPGFEGRFAGRALRPGMEREMGASFLRRLGGLESGLGGEGLLRLGLGGGDVLTCSGFALNRATRHGGTLSLWSRGAQSRFSGREGALSLGGAVRTTMFGTDYAKGRLTAGLSLSHSGGVGQYAGADSGEVVSSVTGLYPWLGYRATERISVWGVAGYGSGALQLTPEGGTALASDLGMALGALGARGELFGAAGYGLAFKADALWVGTSIEGVDGPSGRLKATAAAVTRLRTALEGSRDFRVGNGLSLKPSVEVGVRRDGGDAETGAGLDMGGGVVVSAPSVGLSADVKVRMLLAHEAEEFRERGVSVSLSYDPTPATPFGLQARLSPSWGGQATSGAEALWGRETLSGMARGGFGAAGTRVNADIGYGMPVGRRLVGTPRLAVMTSGMGRDYRLGYGLGVLEGGTLRFELGIDAQRRETPLAGRTNHGVAARAALSW